MRPLINTKAECQLISYFHSRVLVLFILLVSYLGFYSQPVSADFSALSVSPTRVVVTSSERSGSITLNNSSKTAITYRMKLVEMGLDENGQFRVLNKNQLPANHKSAAPIVRFSPRQVRLEPGQSQVIRAIVRRSAKLPNGEYRSHLNIQALPLLDAASLGDLVTEGRDAALLLAKSPTTMGITIPVIVRHKQTSAELAIKKLLLPVDADGMVRRARVLVGREGNRSAYGEIQLLSTSDSDSTLLGSIRGYGIYDPYSEEWVSVLLSKPFHAGSGQNRVSIRAKFIDNEGVSRNGEVLSDTTLSAEFVR